jgi:hypothetical protein
MTNSFVIYDDVPNSLTLIALRRMCPGGVMDERRATTTSPSSRQHVDTIFCEKQAEIVIFQQFSRQRCKNINQDLQDL